MLNTPTGKIQTHDTCTVMVNPFSAGEKVTIPAGTVYLSTNPSVIGRQKTKQTTAVTIELSFPARAVKGANGRCIINPAHIRVRGVDGYIEDFNLTESLVSANGLQPEYASVESIRRTN